MLPVCPHRPLVNLNSPVKQPAQAPACSGPMQTMYPDLERSYVTGVLSTEAGYRLEGFCQ